MMVKQAYIRENNGALSNEEILDIIKKFMDKYPIVSIHADHGELRIDYMVVKKEKFNPTSRKGR